MIIRPSPHKRRPAAESPPQWPPKSPFQALVSSPGGRRQWQQIQNGLKERSLSPSPSRLKHGASVEAVKDEDEGTDEDESSLKLKLEILETRKRLRDIQKKQKKHGGELESGSGTLTGNIDRSPTRLYKRQRLDTSPARSSNRIDVPVSPVKTTASLLSQAISPARARLGLPTTTRAQDISLKRRTQVKGAASVSAPRPALAPAHDSMATQPVSSFSQRLAELKQSNSKKQARSDRLEALRHSTFAARAKEQPQVPVADLAMPYPEPPYPATTHIASPPRRLPRPPSPPKKPARRNKNSKNVEFYDPFSELHLESRALTHAEMAQKLAGSEIYTLPRLLKEVKAPEYNPPDCDTDYVVFGILAEKSAPVKQKPKRYVHNKDDRDVDAVNLEGSKPKFIVLRLCDLQWQVDCYLFGTAFDKYWKLTEGSVLAILNPAIMPPRTNAQSGKFSLKLASSDDCILEIGKARDIGTCSAIRKDSTACTSWTNKSKSTLCEFHLGLLVGRARKGRMEVNSMWRPEEKPREKPPPKSNQQFDHEHGEYWSFGGGQRGAATLLDEDDMNPVSMAVNGDRSRARIAAAQRERDLAVKLGTITGGVASEYFRAAYNLPAYESGAGASQEVSFVKPTAAELGLLGKTAGNQRLSPAKDRKRHFGIGAISSAGAEAMGWGGARKAGLLEPARARIGSPEKGQTTLLDRNAHSATRERSTSPSKKTRFQLASGIKTPGRESGGLDLLAGRHGRAMIDDDHNDDDEDLEIV